MSHSMTSQDQLQLYESAPPVTGHSSSAVIARQKPIVTQPTFGQGRCEPSADSWMAVPALQSTDDKLPASLQYLSSVNRLFIKQEIELFEVFMGFETVNRYSIMNDVGQRVFYAVEESGWLDRICCGTNRAFTIRVFDNYRKDIITARRDFVCCNNFCCPCCLQSMEVFSPPSKVIGTIEEEWSLCVPLYDVKDEYGRTEMKIKGPICRWDICGDLNFIIYSSDNTTEIGVITKQWSGFVRELFTDADFFGISFPLNLNVRMKAVLIGACFLIDFMYFESSQNRPD